MGFLDNVKTKISSIGGGRQDDASYDEYDYDEYDGYEDQYQSDEELEGSQDGYRDRSEPNYRSGLRTSRTNYQLDDHPPLISQSDVRAQGVAELQQAASSGAYGYSSATSSSRSRTSTLAAANRTTVAPYGSEPTELRGDTPDFYASRSGQVRARGATGNFPSQAFRQLVLVRPATYADAEKVADALKEGHAVALDLRNTRPELAKRILDFSFGAASVLGGQVETPANRVYVISVGSALTSEEHELLVARGVV